MGELAEARAELSAGMARIADFILADPESSVSSSIAEVAERTSTSPATVNRFCKHFGFDGYSALRVAVATANGRAEQAQWQQAVGSQVTPEDPLDKIAKIIAADSLRAIQETLDRVDLEPLAAIATAISTARRVSLFGMSGSFLPANELRHRLQTIGLPAWALSDFHDGLTSASMSTDKDVLGVFSHSGRTVETLQVLEAAKRAGATTVAVTNSAASPISSAATHAMLTVVDDGSASRSQALAARHSRRCPTVMREGMQ